ncbi:MAG: DUF3536 domain-containing protein [Gemmatimonadales bacterium]
MGTSRHVVVHAHCYQPPREEPWLELVPRERGAAPDHDWNARITRECYRPLSRARLLDASGRITGLHNAWAWLSFNVGPTLVHWLERHAVDVLEAMVAGDRAAIGRTGHGTAIAHPYHHVILPLASRRDKRTEVRWGLREFRRVFGRDALGMWLPETAVDEETLEILAQEGVRYTILAPHQVTAPDGDGRPLRWRRGDAELLLLPYEGTIAHEVAFGDLLRDADRLAARLGSPNNPRVTAIATDGETYGHHHRFGDLAIAGAIERLSRMADVQLVGADAVMATLEPAGDATLVSPTSWSCIHGVGRWQEECGCRMDPATNQRWRAPLRAGLEVVARGLDAVVEREWPGDAGNRHEVRDIAGPGLDGAGPLDPAVRRLLEAQVHALAMFTSCAWFFDDLARIEPRVVLRHAARALELLATADAEALEAALRTALAEADSNDPADGTGVDIWERDILPGRRATAALVAGIAAVREFAPDALDDLVMPAHTWRVEGDEIITIHRRAGVERRWRTETVSFGVVAERVHVRELDRGEAIVIGAREFPAPFRRRLLALAGPLVMEACFGPGVMGAGELLAAGRTAVREATLEASWGLVARDGLDAADVVVHGALDLYALEDLDLPDDARSRAFERLAALPATTARERLAERFGT